ncbi:hypothetical protein PQU92_12985 [Asticcacaulis sp. BYS171W]|uniref:Uncharacterized protein n=1 Tax=Asticcacaulis aquaticus TaxID=2984212 RepID=A0ABT5HVY2_9CAUL|nr:hypothetical protein [Asticcacaulis aquaticus]MDC7684199.1 hypothetical protein [Asticcacaulis aquaticus]
MTRQQVLALTGAAVIALTPGVLTAQDFLGGLVDRAKQEAERKAREAVKPKPAPQTQNLPVVADGETLADIDAIVAKGGRLSGSMEKEPDLHTRLYSWSDGLETRGNAGPAELKTNISHTPARVKWIDRFEQWLHASYTPLGGLPQAFRTIDPYKAGMKEYRPVAYGLGVIIQHPTMKNGKLTRSPIPSESGINIYANGLVGADGAWEFNTPDSFYFTMYVDPDGTWVDPKIRAEHIAEIAAVRRAVGPDAVVYVNTGRIVVVLGTNGRLPVVPVSIGEALDIAEAGFRRMQVTDPSDPATFSARMTDVARMRQRHAGELDKPARVRNMQYLSGSFASGWDVFGDGDRGVLYPLYKIDPAVYARAAKGDPQWITITFPRIADYSPPRDVAIYKAMTQRFNYGYVKEVLRDPAKAALPYRPLN